MTDSVREVRVRIKVEVIETIQLGPNETIEDLENRLADIYLHGPGELGHQDKFDLGGNATIEVLD